MDILLDQLNGFGAVRKVVLAVGYKAEQIIQRYRGCNTYRFDIAFSTEDEPLGTGGAIKKALPLTNSVQVLVMNGDSYVEFELAKLRDEHKASHATATLVVAKVDNIDRYGSVRIDMQTRRVARFLEKESTHGDGWINAGCYLMERASFDSVECGKPISLEREILPALVFKDAVYAHMSAGRFIDIGTPESYDTAGKMLAGCS